MGSCEHGKTAAASPDEEYGGMEIKLHEFLTLPINRCVQLHIPASLTPKGHRYALYSAVGGPPEHVWALQSSCSKRVLRGSVIREQCTWDPWIHFCNGYFEVNLFFILILLKTVVKLL